MLGPTLIAAWPASGWRHQARGGFASVNRDRGAGFPAPPPPPPYVRVRIRRFERLMDWVCGAPSWTKRLLPAVGASSPHSIPRASPYSSCVGPCRSRHLRQCTSEVRSVRPPFRSALRRWGWVQAPSAPQPTTMASADFSLRRVQSPIGVPLSEARRDLPG